MSAVTAHTDGTAISFLEMRDELDTALSANDTAGWRHLLDRLSDHAVRAIASRNPPEISDLEGKIDRLRRRIARRDDDRAQAVITLLDEYCRLLDRGLTIALMHESAERRSTERAVLKDRILDHLAHHGPTRPRDLVETLQSGPSQVSRTLKALQDAGLVASVTPSGGDRRAVAYALAEARAAA